MLLLNLFLATLASAAPASYPVVHEGRSVSRRAVHDGISKRVDSTAILPIRIALVQSNLEHGYDYLMDIADPDSKNYGRHWTTEEVHAKFAPSEETVEAVTAWLESAGIHREQIKETTSRSWLGVDIPASDAERLFATEYWEISDSEGNLDVGCDKYHVPSHLSHHIDYITPGVQLSTFRKRAIRKPAEISGLQKRSENPLADCGKLMTPTCLKALYDIPAAKYNQKANDLGVFEFGDTYDQKDLNSFYTIFAPNVPNGTHPELISVNNATAPTSVKNGGGESATDFDLAFSLLYPQSIILYQTQPTKGELKLWASQGSGSKMNVEAYASDRAIPEVLLDAVDGSYCTKAEKKAGQDCGTTDLTRVLSVSYGVSELFMPQGAIVRACNEIMKLALKGHSIFISSGDYGVAGHNQEGLKHPPNFCVNPAQIDNYFVNGTVFSPQFPASCPYVTSVGATQLQPKESVNGPEHALHAPNELAPLSKEIIQFSSSGGFSNYFAMPGYQKSAVETYLNDHNPGYKTYKYTGKGSVGAGGGVYASGGRGIPDVSANGFNLGLFVNGEFTPVSGTSLATPIWASLITMVNQERTAAGKGPVGFINPVLYKNPGIFTDITRGNNPGCGTEGFSAVEGWDPITGLGTPNYTELLKVFMALP